MCRRLPPVVARQVVAVERGDHVERDLLRAGHRALADVGAAAEALGVVLLDHVDHAFPPLGLALRQLPRCAILAPRNSDAEPFGHAATQAPQPMQAAAVNARSAFGLGTGVAGASGAEPVGAEM